MLLWGTSKAWGGGEQWQMLKGPALSAELRVVALADFAGVNTPPVAKSKLPRRCR